MTDCCPHATLDLVGKARQSDSLHSELITSASSAISPVQTQLLYACLHNTQRRWERITKLTEWKSCFFMRHLIDPLKAKQTITFVICWVSLWYQSSTWSLFLAKDGLILSNSKQRQHFCKMAIKEPWNILCTLVFVLGLLKCDIDFLLNIKTEDKKWTPTSALSDFKGLMHE